MRNAGAFDAAEKPPRPTAPPMELQSDDAAPPAGFVARQHETQGSLHHPYAGPQTTVYDRQPPVAPMPPMPPMAAPHVGYFPPTQAQAPPKYDAQYLPPPPPPPPTYVSDEYHEEDSSFQAFLKETGRLALFHALNGLLGYVAFSVCVGGVATSVGLLPLCCFGIVVFRLVLYAVYGFAQLDVMLYNFITPPEDHVYVQVPRSAALSGERLAPTLAAFSPLSLMALIYFCSVKFLLSTLSSVCVSLTVTAPLSLVFAVLGLGHGPAFSVQLGPEDVADFDSQPLLFLLATACLFVIGVALMHLVAKASREATRFFCCEQFSTYRYVHHPSQSHVGYPPAAAPLAAGPPPSYAYGAIPTATAAATMDPYCVPAQQNTCGNGNGSGGAVIIRFNASGA